MRYYNDGSDQQIWDPLYRKQTNLTLCEQAILQNPALRRLQSIAHYGASARILPMTHTRYVHTLGVFTLAAHFCPEELLLRLAALLHDIGHLPFSHSAERALGLDHHELTIRLMERSGIDDLLKQHGFNPVEILRIIDGTTPTPLVCGGNRLSLDHIDSWLRDTHTIGFGEVPPHELLGRLRLNGNFLEASDEQAALDVVRRVAEDHKLFLQPRCLAMDALVTEIFRLAHPDVDHLLTIGDEQALDLAAEGAPHLVSLLRLRPWEIGVRPDDGGAGVPVSVRKLYTGQILLEGRPAGEALAEAAGVYKGLEALKRTYRVTWGPLSYH